jgi:hypothetical protein
MPAPMRRTLPVFPLHTSCTVGPGLPALISARVRGDIVLVPRSVPAPLPPWPHARVCVALVSVVSSLGACAAAPSEIGNSSFMGPQIYQRDPYRSVLACLDATSRKISTFMSARNPCLMALAAGKGTSLSVCRCVFRLGAVGSVYGAAPAADSVELRRRATPCALSRLRCNTGTIICEHVTCAAPFWEGARLQPHRAMSPQRAGCGALAN